MKHLNLFENTFSENMEVIAKNESHYSWEYDSHTTTAQILLDRTDDSLYIKIRTVHNKSGLGAGSYPKDLEFKRIGNLHKADLTLVRSLLTKYNYSYSQQKFSKHWEDEEGNKMTLSELLKLYKPEKTIREESPKKELKHIQSISSFSEPKKSDIEIVKYSDRAYAIFGEGTKNIKEKLIELGCRYNKFLTDPKTGEKRPGWICSISKIDLIKNYI
jgi:hypothetical protein